ncbi:hypothetical protein Cfor_12946, partial [Coptotermes formosanus]
KKFPVLLAVETWIVVVAAQGELFTARTPSEQAVSTQLTTPTGTVTIYTPTSDRAEESNGHLSEPSTIITSTFQDTSNKPLSEIEFTQQETVTEQPAAKATIELTTDDSASETSSGLLDSTEFRNVSEISSTGFPVDIVKVSDSEAGADGPNVTDGVETNESGTSGGVLGTESMLNTESNALSTEHVPVIKSETTVPNSVEISSHGCTPYFNNVSSTTECPVFPVTIFPISYDTHTPHYHCTRPGHFPARATCTDYHVCRLVGFWFVHFKETCHFGLQFNARLRLCVPSYLSDCRLESL